ncbi:hypothetical protein HPY86_01265 [candidate division WOR-3 bacterium]|nr:hypothetical protein [candidate division WOR-3 bacterium]
MALIVIIGLVVMSQDLVADGSSVGPDEEDFYETVEDSLAQLEATDFTAPRTYRLSLRMGCDSSFNNGIGCRAFTRLKGSTEKREILLLIDKDRGERNWADFIGGGVTFAGNGWRFTAGDFIVFFGRGLLITSPAVRAGFRWNLTVQPRSSLAQTAQENRNLRGIKFDFSYGPLIIGMFGSYSLRDAVLNSDGTVKRLSFSGVHDDSASQWSKNQLSQKLAGVVINYQGKKFKTGVGGYGANFDRNFSPEDSLGSFYGRTLGGLSVYAGYGNSSRFCEIEVAHSFPGGGAVAGQIGFDTAGIRVRISGTGYQASFFSPAGRIYSITGRRARFDLTGAVSYKLKFLQFGLDGNTYRDYTVDSIPARVNVHTSFEGKGYKIRCLLGRIYRLEQERSRRARLEMSTEGQRLRFGFLVEDEYADYTDGQGVLVALSSGIRIKEFGAQFAVSRFFISGSGVELTVSEPGTMRIGSSYSSRESGWRIVAAGYGRRDKIGRWAIKFGATRINFWKFDLSGQLELEASCD